MENNDTDYKAYNVGGNTTISVIDYAYMLIKLTGRSIEPEINSEFRFGDTRHIISDVSKLENLGWKPSVSLENIARGYINWVEKQLEVRDYYTRASEEMKTMGVIKTAKVKKV